MKLKRIFSLVVTLTLVFSMITISNTQAAEDEFAILKSLGINTDFSDDSTPITRYQLAELALELTGTVADAVGEPAYPDVPAKHKDFPVVNAVTKAGLMGPIADGSFSPNSPASAMDFGRIMLNELGYTALANQANWSDAQYNSTVQTLGLTKGIGASEVLTYHVIGKMYINMLTTRVMEVSSVTAEGVKFTESKYTYIEKKYGYILKKGVVQANGYTSTPSFSPVKYNQIVISEDENSKNGIVYKTDGRSYSDYVGYYTKYILTSEYEDGQVIHVEKYKPTEELVIDAKDITGYDNYRLSYIDENGESDVVNFSSTARVVVNGQNMITYNAKYFTPKVGSVTFVDTDANDDYDLVNIKTGVYYKVGGATVNSVSDKFTFSTIYTEDFDSYVYSNGIGAELMSVEENEYLEVFPGALSFTDANGNEDLIKPDFDNSKIMTINILSTTNVSGVITGKKEGCIAIDGIVYNLNPYYMDLVAYEKADSIGLGANITAVLNDKGEIIDIPTVTTDYSEITGDLIYGYMLKMLPVRNDENGRAVIRMVDVYNLEEILLTTAEGCKFNGDEFDYEEINSIDPTKNSTCLYWPDGSPKEQLVKYALNKDGEITDFYMFTDNYNKTLMSGYGGLSEYDNPDYDSTYRGYDSNKFSLDRSGNDLYGHTAIIENLYTISPSETIMMKIPPVPTELNKWSVYIKQGNEVSGTVVTPFVSNALEIYDVSEEFVCGVVIKREEAGGGATIGTGYSSTKPTAVVVAIEDVFDDVENEVKRQLTVLYPSVNGVKKENLLATDDKLKSTWNTYKYYFETPAKQPTISWSDLKVGDIIRFTKDAAGLVAGFGLLLDGDVFDKNSPIYYPYGPVSYYDAQLRRNYYNHFDMGYVVKTFADKGSIMNIEGPNGSSDGLMKISPYAGAGGGNSKGCGMIYYKKTRTAIPANIADLKVGDIALMHTSSNANCELIVIRD